MPLEVICAGWARTGTMSQKIALDKLGYNCYHMMDAIQNRHGQLWIKAWDGNPDWEKVFSGYTATTDWPACSFVEELLKQYPDAKVILNVRDPDKWYKSMHDTVFQAKNVEIPWYIKPIVSMLAPHMEMADHIIWQGTFHGKFGSNPDEAKALFLEYMEQIKRLVPAEKLLVYQVSEGWGPLCAFLGKEVPQEPFPHVNDAAYMKERIKMFSRSIMVMKAAVPVVAAAVVGLVAWSVRGKMGKVVG